MLQAAMAAKEAELAAAQEGRQASDADWEARMKARATCRSLPHEEMSVTLFCALYLPPLQVLRTALYQFRIQTLTHATVDKTHA